MKRKDDLITKFNQLAEKWLGIKSQKKQLEDEEKAIKPEISEIIKASGGEIKTDKFVGKFTKRTRKTVRKDAPALLKEFIGEKEAKKYLIVVEELPEESINKLLNAGIITPEQADALFEIKISEFPTVKEVK